MKALNRIVFTVYIGVLFYILFLASRRPAPTFLKHEEPLNIFPVRRKIAYFQSGPKTSQERWNFYSDLLGNVIIFIPFAFVLVLYTRMNNFRQVVLVTMLTSFCVESAQFIFSIGVADTDDVLLNTIGAGIGYWLYRAGLKHPFVRACLQPRS